MNRVIVAVLLLSAHRFAFAQSHHEEFRYYTTVENIIYANKEPQYVTFLNLMRSNNGGLDERYRTVRFPVLLEANINPYFFFVRPNVNKSIRGNSHLLFFNPIINFRMYREIVGDENYSSPIRPMNAKPTLSYAYFLNSHLKDPEKRRYPYLQVDLAHYSNGQQESAEIDSKPNLKSGNFSTNYINVGLNYPFYLPRNDSEKRRKGDYYLSFGTLYQKDIWWEGSVLDREPYLFGRLPTDKIISTIKFRRNQMAGDSLERRLNGREGQHNLVLLYDHARIAEDGQRIYRVMRSLTNSFFFHNRHDFELGIKHQVHVNRLGSFDRHNYNRARHAVTVDFAYQATWMRGTGIFSRFYYGRDYMNIRFNDVISYLQVGLRFELNKHVSPRHKFMEDYYDEPLNLIYGRTKPKDSISFSRKDSESTAKKDTILYVRRDGDYEIVDGKLHKYNFKALMTTLENGQEVYLSESMIPYRTQVMGRDTIYVHYEELRKEMLKIK